MWLQQGPMQTARMFTLGYTAHLSRNLVLGTALGARYAGSNNEAFNALWTFGALLLSHPFEVVRVMIVHGEKSHLTGRCW